jgi:hypothetical protein
VLIIFVEFSPKNPKDSDRFIWYLFLDLVLMSAVPTSILLAVIAEAGKPLCCTTYPFIVDAVVL